MHLYYLDIWSVVDAMWSCLYGFVLDILCVKHIICTLNCDMRNMSKFSIFFVIPSQNKISGSQTANFALWTPNFG